MMLIVKLRALLVIVCNRIVVKVGGPVHVEINHYRHEVILHQDVHLKPDSISTDGAIFKPDRFRPIYLHLPFKFMVKISIVARCNL